MLGEPATQQSEGRERGGLKAEDGPDDDFGLCPVHWVEARLAYAVTDQDDRAVNVYRCEPCDGYWARDDLL